MQSPGYCRPFLTNPVMDRLSWLCFLAVVASVAADVPCAPRHGEESVVCVCSAAHCDTLTRERPASGEFVEYTSNKDGLRFEKNTGEIVDPSTITILRAVLEVNTSHEYQAVEGFGGSVTDAASINWKSLSPKMQKTLTDAYFSTTGLEYNMVRVPIGGCDFSTHPYAYNELPEHDVKLSNYSLTVEDYEFKLPMIRSLLEAATAPVHIIASAWSPPLWMKTNDEWFGFSRLKTEYHQTYADYHLKFLEQYAKEGVDIWAITTTNEPINGVVPFVRFNSLGWTPAVQAEWIVNHLGPTIRRSSFWNTKIIAADDQRYTAPIWMHAMVRANASVLDYVDGIGVHWYGNMFTADLLVNVHDNFPGKFIIGTEACEGSSPWQLQSVILGSWRRAEAYIQNILEDLNHWSTGWIDWNMALSPTGGPNWANNFVDSPILVFANEDQFIKQPMYYAMGHFSKFIPRGSKRVDISSTSTVTVEHVAFKTPEGTLVVVLYNSGLLPRNVDLVVDGGRQVSLSVGAKTVKTVELLL